MNEDLNRHEAELNDAELTGVSGGDDYNYTQAARTQAQLCSNCHWNNPSKENCTHGSELKSYLMANGVKSIPFFQKCPYYKS